MVCISPYIYFMPNFFFSWLIKRVCEDHYDTNISFYVFGYFQKTIVVPFYSQEANIGYTCLDISLSILFKISIVHVLIFRVVLFGLESPLHRILVFEN